MEGTQKTKNISELRQDLITGDWVVIAPARSDRPDHFSLTDRGESHQNDPFNNPEASGQAEDLLVYRHADGDWSLRVFPNKYPAVARGRKQKDLSVGPYTAQTGVGYHEVIVTRDAHKSIPDLETWRVAELFDAYHERYLALMNKKSVRAIQIFHNHGKQAGASLPHPHSQLIAVPVIDPDMTKSLHGAERYFRQNKKNAFGVILEFEQKEKKRILFENEHFVAFCPFASRASFAVTVLPKRDNPYFERITEAEKLSGAEALQEVLSALAKTLHSPAYNFYIRTAPCDGSVYPHYRWYIEIIPRVSIEAGFELASGIEIVAVAPEVAALLLRQHISKEKL
jgi:UDPglucose--hexose-1-phosphate uridylyltransferase